MGRHFRQSRSGRSVRRGRADASRLHVLGTGANVVRDAVAANLADGTYTFTLLDDLTHESGQGENLLGLDFAFTATNGADPAGIISDSLSKGM